MISYYGDDSSKLQDYTKNLLNTLKEQQNKTNKCLNKLQPKYSNDDQFLFDSKISNLKKTDNLLTNLNEDINNKLLKFELSKLNLLNTKSQKSVKFNDYLHSASPRYRRARSVSPKLYSVNSKKKVSNKKNENVKYKPKSILKKNLYDTDTDTMDDYDDLKRILKNHNYEIVHGNNKTKNGINRDAFIECLSKSRQKYLNHLYTENQVNDSNEIQMSTIKKKKINKKSKPQTDSDSENTHWKYLFDEGNNRNLRGSLNLPRPKSEPILKMHSNEDLTNLKIKSNKKMSNNKLIQKSKTILGYDWITDALENRNNSFIEKSDDYWNELTSFRKQNKDDCISDNIDDRSFFSYGDKNLNEDSENFRHKCIHSYTLNERLFAVPTYVNENGESVCPVCKNSRREPTNYSPQFCKISIPQSKLLDNYTIKPQKRSQYTREDTLSLSEHCVAGFQNIHKTQSIGRSKNIDLKSATGSPSDYVKFTTDDLKRIAANKDPTIDLYNKGHAMRYELENQHQKRLRELAPKIHM